LTAAMLESMGEVLALLRKSGIDPHLAFDVFTGSLFDGRVYKLSDAKDRDPPTSEHHGKRSPASRRERLNSSCLASTFQTDPDSESAVSSRHHRNTAAAAGGANKPITERPEHGGLVTVAEAAKELRVSQRSVRRWIALGQVRNVPLGRAVRIPRSELRRLVEAGLAGGTPS
jgi:excisionase family DNA binding protein